MIEMMNEKEFYNWLHDQDDVSENWTEEEHSSYWKQSEEDMKLSYTALIDKYYTDEELEEEIISYPSIFGLQKELQDLKQVLRRRKLNKLK